MNPAASGLQLRDIHLPEAVSAWPPAIGWWLVLLLTLLFLFFLPKLIRRLIRWIKFRPIKKIALEEFDAISQANKNNSELLAAVSSFFRRLSMSYKGREHSASLTGEAWISELQSLNSKNCLPSEVSVLLKQGPYQKSIDFNQQEFIQHCRSWLLELPRRSVETPSKNASTNIAGQKND